MTIAQIHAGRMSKRDQILQFFLAHVGVEYGSFELHARWGTAFRSRTSEINRDADAPITIRNRVAVHGGREESIYWAEPRVAVGETIPLPLAAEGGADGR